MIFDDRKKMKKMFCASIKKTKTNEESLEKIYKYFEIEFNALLMKFLKLKKISDKKTFETIVEAMVYTFVVCLVDDTDDALNIFKNLKEGLITFEKEYNKYD